MDEKVAVVTMNDGENRFNPPFLDAFSQALLDIENETDANALVVTSSEGNRTTSTAILDIGANSKKNPVFLCQYRGI